MTAQEIVKQFLKENQHIDTNSLEGYWDTFSEKLVALVQSDEVKKLHENVVVKERSDYDNYFRAFQNHYGVGPETGMTMLKNAVDDIETYHADIFNKETARDFGTHCNDCLVYLDTEGNDDEDLEPSDVFKYKRAFCMAAIHYKAFFTARKLGIV